MTSARDLIVAGTTVLEAAEVTSAQKNALDLLAHVLNDESLSALSEREISQDDEVAFVALIAQRATRIPLQHLTGKAYFRHLELLVGPGVFIPRPETELLAQVVIDELKRIGGGIAVELCAGSGAIALSVATEVPNVTVHAVEKSPDAFEWLNKNVAKHSEELTMNGSRVFTYLGDATDAAILEALNGSVAVVATNPPYIPDAMIPREPEVRDHDPHMALFGGSDGFDVARGVIAVAHKLLIPNGLFGMEHADVQRESVLELLDGWIDPVDHMDYNQLPRYVTARSGRVESL